MATASGTSKRLAPSAAVKTVAQLEQEWSGKPRRGKKKWLVAAALLAVGVYFAPWLICHSPLRAWAVGRATNKLQGSVQVGWASASWFSAIEAGDIEVRDADGQVIAALPRVSLEKSILGLMRDSKNLGVVKLQGLHLDLKLRPDGSNLEDLLKTLLAQPSSPGNTAVTLEMHDASISLHDAAGQQSQLDQLEVNLTLPPGADLPSELAISGNAIAGARHGQFSVQLGTAGQTADAATPRAFEFKCQTLPLAAISPLLGRFLRDGYLAGSFSGAARGQVSGNRLEQLRADLQGQIAADDLAVGGLFAPGEQLRLEKLGLPLKMAFHDQRLDVEQFELTCDLAQISVRGSFPLSGRNSLEMLRTWLNENAKVEGQLDLARLAQRLPKTFNIREGLQLNSGTMTFAAESLAARGGQSWQASLQTSPISAMADGKPIVWNNPISLSLAAHDTREQGPTIDSLLCKAGFLTAQAAGSIDRLDASAVCNLDRLGSELGQFVDLSNCKLAGTGTAQLQWQRQNGVQAIAKGSVLLKNVQVMRPGALPWTEDSMAVYFNADGIVDGTQLTQITAATIDLQAAGEDGKIQLLTPVKFGPNAIWKLKTALRGPVAKWAARLQPIYSLDGWLLDGTADLTVDVAYSAASIDIADGQLAINRMRAWGSGFFVDDPSMLLQTTGRWDSAAKKLLLGKTLLNTAALNLETDDLTIVLPEKGGPQMAGTLRLDGDAGKLMAWVNDPRKPPSTLAVGRLSGQARLATQGGMVTAKLGAAIDRFALYSGDAPQLAARNITPQPIWQEQKVEFAADGTYDSASDSAKLGQLDLTAQALRLQASGAALKVSDTCDVDLNGQLDYDLPALTKLLAPYLGAVIELDGRESRKFSLRGPINPAAPVGTKAVPLSLAARLLPLTAQSSLGWQGATLYGLKIGAGEISASLGKGQLDVKPLNLPLSEGKLTFAPQFDLQHEPAKMLLGQGPLISEVRITPEVCATGLKFIAPALADATRAEGKFSVNLAGGQLPLSAPATGDIGGQLTVHNVSILPGPSAKSMVALSRQIIAMAKGQTPAGDSDDRAVLTMNEQAIEFRMVNGRVYHQGMTMQAGEVTIRTRGSVGVADETLDLVAEFPIKPEWAAKSPLLAGFGDRPISIPIRGTLSHPQVDGQILQQLGAQLIQGAARNAIEKNLEGGLDRLFRQK